MIERVVRIGQPVALQGVVSEPEGFDPELPAVLLLNSGVIHHIGACRLSVKLARDITEKAGLLTLRFDFSGVGDSPARAARGSLDETTQAEIREVMDHLATTRGIRRFILYGLCSGAHNSVRAAIDDERIEGIIQIDGYCFPTWKSYLHAYLPRLLSPASWYRFVARGLGFRRDDASAANQAVVDAASEFFEVPDFGRELTRPEMTENLRTIISRGTRLLCVFTSQHLTYNYAGQYRDCYGEVAFGDLLSVHYMPAANHIITEPQHQTEVVECISDWLCDRAGDPTAVTRTLS